MKYHNTITLELLLFTAMWVRSSFCFRATKLLNVSRKMSFFLSPLQFHLKISVNSSLVQHISLDADTDFLRFDTEVKYSSSSRRTLNKIVLFLSFTAGLCAVFVKRKRIRTSSLDFF